MRRCGEIGGADLRPRCIAPEQILDAGAIRAGRHAENAVRPVIACGARRGGKRVLVIFLIARRNRAGGIVQYELRPSLWRHSTRLFDRLSGVHSAPTL